MGRRPANSGTGQRITHRQRRFSAYAHHSPHSLWLTRTPRFLRSLRYSFDFAQDAAPVTAGRGVCLSESASQSTIAPPFQRGVDRGTHGQRHDAALERACPEPFDKLRAGPAEGLWVFRANTLTVGVLGKAARGAQGYNGQVRPACTMCWLIQCRAGQWMNTGDAVQSGHVKGIAQPNTA